MNDLARRRALPTIFRTPAWNPPTRESGIFQSRYTRPTLSQQRRFIASSLPLCFVHPCFVHPCASCKVFEYRTRFVQFWLYMLAACSFSLSLHPHEFSMPFIGGRARKIPRRGQLRGHGRRKKISSTRSRSEYVHTMHRATSRVALRLAQAILQSQRVTHLPIYVNLVWWRPCLLITLKILGIRSKRGWVLASRKLARSRFSAFRTMPYLCADYIGSLSHVLLIYLHECKHFVSNHTFRNNPGLSQRF